MRRQACVSPASTRAPRQTPSDTQLQIPSSPSATLAEDDGSRWLRICVRPGRLSPPAVNAPIRHRPSTARVKTGQFLEEDAGGGGHGRGPRRGPVWPCICALQNVARGFTERGFSKTTKAHERTSEPPPYGCVPSASRLSWLSQGGTLGRTMFVKRKCTHPSQSHHRTHDPHA